MGETRTVGDDVVYTRCVPVDVDTGVTERLLELVRLDEPVGVTVELGEPVGVTVGLGEPVGDPVGLGEPVGDPVWLEE